MKVKCDGDWLGVIFWLAVAVIYFGSLIMFLPKRTVRDKTESLDAIADSFSSMQEDIRAILLKLDEGSAPSEMPRESER